MKRKRKKNTNTKEKKNEKKMKKKKCEWNNFLSETALTWCFATKNIICVLRIVQSLVGENLSHCFTIYIVKRRFYCNKEIPLG